MSKQRVINENNLPTNELVNSLARGYGIAINNKIRYDISCCEYSGHIEDLLLLKSLLTVSHCYSEEGDSRVTREMIINEHAKNIKEI